MRSENRIRYGTEGEVCRVVAGVRFLFTLVFGGFLFFLWRPARDLLTVDYGFWVGLWAQIVNNWPNKKSPMAQRRPICRSVFLKTLTLVCSWRLPRYKSIHYHYHKNPRRPLAPWETQKHRMVSLKLQKRLAASVLKCGRGKVWLDPNEVNEISMANSSKSLAISVSLFIFVFLSLGLSVKSGSEILFDISLRKILEFNPSD